MVVASRAAVNGGADGQVDEKVARSDMAAGGRVGDPGIGSRCVGSGVLVSDGSA